MVMSEKRPSSLALIVLGTLLEEPMYVYRMQKLIRERGKHKVVNIRRGASLYQTLDRLVRLRLVEVQKTEKTESHPDRIIYKITGQGRDTARTWLRQMLTSVGNDFPDFPAAVSTLAMLTPEDAQKQLEIRSDVIRDELIQLETDKKKVGDLPRLFLLEDAYRTAVLKAEHTWLQSVIADLRSEELTWSDQWLREIAAKFTPPGSTEENVSDESERHSSRNQSNPDADPDMTTARKKRPTVRTAPKPRRA